MKKRSLLLDEYKLLFLHIREFFFVEYLEILQILEEWCYNCT